MKTEMPNREPIIAKLNQILEHEMVGVVRYTHYSFMVFGFSRIPVVNWFRSAANETLAHATEAGEMITLIGGYPSLGIGPLLETHHHDLREMLRESMDFEIQGVDLYRQLLTLAVEAGSVTIEEYARKKISDEAMHIGDIDKMLRRPGNISQAVKTEAP